MVSDCNPLRTYNERIVLINPYYGSSTTKVNKTPKETTAEAEGRLETASMNGDWKSDVRVADVLPTGRGFEAFPKGPSTQCLRSLVPKTVKGTLVVEPIALKY